MKKKWKMLLAMMCTGCLLCTGAQGEASKFTQEMVDRSLVSVGNTERLHRAMDKARNGEKVTIAYLGGSITEGALASPQQTNCYAALSARAFAEKYMADPALLHYVNAGISGTPSLLGATRLEKDVLRHQPDIVFVEFAVNDGSDLISQQVYESLIRNLLQSESQPAVILIFTFLENGYSAQEHMQNVGTLYKLGMISVRDALKPAMDQGALAWGDYSPDYAHPSTQGHAFLAELIAHYFAQAEKESPVPFQMPRFTRYGKMLEGIKNIRQGDPRIVTEGDFPYQNARCYSYDKGWCHRTYKDDPQSMILELNARRMTIVFKQENSKDCGTAEILVDGEVKMTLPGYSQSAWGNPVTQLLSLSGEGPHTIEIRMAEGNEKKRFTLLDFGYVE